MRSPYFEKYIGVHHEKKWRLKRMKMLPSYYFSQKLEPLPSASVIPIFFSLFSLGDSSPLYMIMAGGRGGGITTVLHSFPVHIQTDSWCLNTWDRSMNKKTSFNILVLSLKLLYVENPTKREANIKHSIIWFLQSEAECCNYTLKQ